MIKIILVLLAVAVVLGSILLHCKEKGFALAVAMALLAFGGDILSEVVADYVKPLFYDSASSVTERQPEQAAPDNGLEYTTDANAGTVPQPEAVPAPQPAPQPAPEPENTPAPAPEPAPEPLPQPEPEPVPQPEPQPEPEPADPLSGLTDISGMTAVSGSVVEKDQVNQYRYTAPISGTYRFETDLGFNNISLKVSNAYGTRLGGGSGSDGTALDLEAGKTYILSIEYRKPLDYTVQIYVPNPVADITGQTSFSGSLTYYDQKDRYTYTAPVSGIYRFDSGRGFGALSIQVLNEQGGKTASGSASTTAELEAGRTYTLVLEESGYFFDYTIQINIPNPPTDISAQWGASGTLVYMGQEDRYFFAAPMDGTYEFSTGISYGGPTMKILDESKNNAGRGRGSISVSLKGGTVYTLTVYQEYQTLPLDYAISITQQ